MLWKTLGLLLMCSKASEFKHWQISLTQKAHCSSSDGWSERKGTIMLHYTNLKYQAKQNIKFSPHRKLPECIIKKNQYVCFHYYLSWPFKEKILHKIAIQTSDCNNERFWKDVRKNIWVSESLPYIS